MPSVTGCEINGGFPSWVIYRHFGSCNDKVFIESKVRQEFVAYLTEEFHRYSPKDRL